MAAPEDTRWVTSAVLVALAARLIYRGGKFTSTDMRAWIPSLKGDGQRKQAAETLLRAGFVQSIMRVDDKGSSYAEYTVTAEGEAAIKAAASGKRLTSGPKGPHQGARAAPANTTFIARLWALMRARQMLDSETAASTLIDAGGEIQKAAKNAQRYFARWASAGAIKESRVRESNGCKRYVLVKDSPTPPPWTPKAQARTHAAQGGA